MFIFDFITIVPVRQILIKMAGGDDFQIVLMIKVMRLYHGFKFLDYKSYVKQLKELQLKHLKGSE